MDESIIDVVPPSPNTEDEEDQPQPTHKKRRGRPKKVKTEEELLEEEQNKKTRGRPKGSFKLDGKVTTEDKKLYFQNYYIEKLKEKMCIKGSCNICGAIIANNKIKRHQDNSKYCKIIQQIKQTYNITNDTDFTKLMENYTIKIKKNNQQL